MSNIGNIIRGILQSEGWALYEADSFDWDRPTQVRADTMQGDTTYLVGPRIEGTDSIPTETLRARVLKDWEEFGTPLIAVFRREIDETVLEEQPEKDGPLYLGKMPSNAELYGGRTYMPLPTKEVYDGQSSGIEGRILDNQEALAITIEGTIQPFYQMSFDADGVTLYARDGGAQHTHDQFLKALPTLRYLNREEGRALAIARGALSEEVRHVVAMG